MQLRLSTAMPSGAGNLIAKKRKNLPARKRGSRSPSRGYFLRLLGEALEPRHLLSFVPATTFQYNPGGVLNPPTSGEPVDIALNYLQQHASQLGLATYDLLDALVTDQYTDSDTGLTHI